MRGGVERIEPVVCGFFIFLHRSEFPEILSLSGVTCNQITEFQDISAGE